MMRSRKVAAERRKGCQVSGYATEAQLEKIDKASMLMDLSRATWIIKVCEKAADEVLENWE